MAVRCSWYEVLVCFVTCWLLSPGRLSPGSGGQACPGSLLSASVMSCCWCLRCLLPAHGEGV